MKKILGSAIVLALASTAVNAAQINVRYEHVPEWGTAADSKNVLKNREQHNYRIAFSERLSNGVGFGVEAKLQSSPNSGFLQDVNTAGTQGNISYRWRFADDFSLTPQLKYETNNDYKLTRQANLTLGYKVSKELSTSVRYRYNYDTWAPEKERDYSEHYNQFSFAASYKGLPYVNLSGSVDYRIKREFLKANGDHRNTVDEDNKGIAEFVIKAAYTELGAWEPFVEYGGKSGYKNNASVKDSMIPQYRVGVAYKW